MHGRGIPKIIIEVRGRGEGLQWTNAMYHRSRHGPYMINLSGFPGKCSSWTAPLAGAFLSSKGKAFKRLRMHAVIKFTLLLSLGLCL